MGPLSKTEQFYPFKLALNAAWLVCNILRALIFFEVPDKPRLLTSDRIKKVFVRLASSVGSANWLTDVDPKAFSVFA